MTLTYQMFLLIMLFPILELYSFLSGTYSSSFIYFILLSPYWLYIINSILFKPTMLKSYQTLSHNVLRNVLRKPVLLAGVLLFIATTFIAFFRCSANGLIPWQKAFSLVYQYGTATIFISSCLISGVLYVKLVQGMVLSAGSFIIINLALFFLGVENPNNQFITFPGDNTLLELFGVHVQRALFPLGGGLNNVGVESAISIAIAFFSFLSAESTLKKFGFIFIGFAGLITVVMIDSRASLFSSLMAILLIWITRLYGNKLIKFLILLLPFIPVFILEITFWLNQNKLAQFLGRGDSGILSTRDVIWSQILLKLSEFKPEHLIGYGSYGQVLSGVYTGYGYLFEKDTNYGASTSNTIFSASAHNSIFQLVLDQGYLGVILYIILLFKSVDILAKSKKRIELPNCILLVGLVYTSLIGASEIVLQNTPILFGWLLFTSVLSLAYEENSQETEHQLNQGY